MNPIKVSAIIETIKKSKFGYVMAFNYTSTIFNIRLQIQECIPFGLTLAEREMLKKEIRERSILLIEQKRSELIFLNEPQKQ